MHQFEALWVNPGNRILVSTEWPRATPCTIPFFWIGAASLGFLPKEKDQVSGQTCKPTNRNNRDWRTIHPWRIMPKNTGNHSLETPTTIKKIYFFGFWILEKVKFPYCILGWNENILFYFTIQCMVKYCNRAWKKCFFFCFFFSKYLKKALISEHRKNYIFRDNKCFVKMSVSLLVCL